MNPVAADVSPRHPTETNKVSADSRRRLHGQFDLDSAALKTSFAALQEYGSGSSRAALLPIDEAVVASLGHKPAQKELERRFVAALKAGGSVPAREYICSKLTLMGSDHCVAALAALLNTPELSTAARNALEAIPGRQASKALRDSLPHVEGLQKIGVINSLGARRDADSVRVLTALLRDADTEIAAAAAGALGEIATAKAASAVKKFLPHAPPTIRPKVADACLNCAEHLLAADNKAEAGALFHLLAADDQPKHVQKAAALALEAASVK